MRYRLGIVLSGGGSRGLAHAGVLRALIENGIEPDCISGTSAGALVGALHASGRCSEEILRFFDDANPFRLSRVALRKPGVIDSEKLVGAFESWFPEDSFARSSCRSSSPAPIWSRGGSKSGAPDRWCVRCSRLRPCRS